MITIVIAAEEAAAAEADMEAAAEEVAVAAVATKVVIAILGKPFHIVLSWFRI